MDKGVKGQVNKTAQHKVKNLTQFLQLIVLDIQYRCPSVTCTVPVHPMFTKNPSLVLGSACFCRHMQDQAVNNPIRSFFSTFHFLWMLWTPQCLYRVASTVRLLGNALQVLIGRMGVGV